MKLKSMLLALAISCSTLWAVGENIILPAPDIDKNATLIEALQNRRSERNFDTARTVDAQQLSNLLWAAWGYNRADKRTAPTALNRQDITLYVFLSQGVYRYNARENTLVAVDSGDHRVATGKQPFVNTAPVNIVFVSDTRLLDSETMSAVGCGAISQNISLYCAVAGLATVVRGSFDADALHKILHLDAAEKVMLAQTVGYPAQ